MTNEEELTLGRLVKASLVARRQYGLDCVALKEAEEASVVSYDVSRRASAALINWRNDGPAPRVHVAKYAPTKEGLYECMRCGKAGMDVSEAGKECGAERGVWVSAQ